MNKPAHLSGTAGQIDNSKELDKLAYKSRPKTLGDVIDNVLVSEQQLSKKKLSFDDWWNDAYTGSTEREYAEYIWKAAQENV